jgi:hypothetical protein
MEIAAEVERLLHAIERNQQFLLDPAFSYAAPLIAKMVETGDLPPGTVLGGYEITGLLGRGGMATVYLAQDLKLHRPVALKVLRRDLAATVGGERFLREIAIAARLNHPHILALHDSGEAEGQLYYVMPFVEGESLADKLKREGQLPVAEAVVIVEAVASALTNAHRQGIIHRDIKPENILLSRKSEGRTHPLVADFGIARALDLAGGEHLTETGIALGTPVYMSPEQAASDSRLDGRSDIYSLGCVAYEMLAGQPPFTGPTAQAILARHAVDPIPPLHTVRNTVPPAAEAAIERALAKVPADRFATAAEFAAALTAPHVAQRRDSRRRATVVLGIVAGITFAGIAAGMLWNSRRSAVSPAATSMAVFPLIAGSTDTALTRLGKDLAITLSASLDGVGGISTTDRLRVANATADKPGLSAVESAALAKRLGASSLLRGTLVGVGEKVRLDLGLYRAQGLTPLVQGITVTGHRDSIAALTDSVSWALLPQIWRHGEPPSPSLSSVTTRSLPALRAFLQGERELGANRWDEAALAFQSAIAADSTFWLAHFRYALARWWMLESPEPAILRALRLHKEALPERDRLLAEPFLEKTGEEDRIERFQLVTRDFPEYWPGWFLYADALFHFGPENGLEWTESLRAFQQVVALNPNLVPAWEHIFKLTVARDPAEASRAFTQLRRLGWLAQKEPWPRGFFQLLARVSEAGGALPSDREAFADSLARLLVSSPDEYMRKVGRPFGLTVIPIGLLQLGFPQAQHDLNNRALRLISRGAESGTGSFPASRALLAANAWIWAVRGQWDSALAILGTLAAEEPGLLWQDRFKPPGEPEVGGPVIAIESFCLGTVGAWLGATSPDTAIKRRPAALAVVDLLADETSRQDARGRIAWFDGILGFVRRDREAIQAARRDAARSGYSQAGLVQRSLAAFELALGGELKQAGHALAELDRECMAREGCNLFTPSTAIQRLAAAQWLLQAGELEEAARIARSNDGMEWYSFQFILHDVLRAPAYLVRARVERARGDPGLASRYYQRFLQLYDQPAASRAHLVTEAKEAVVLVEGNR